MKKILGIISLLLLCFFANGQYTNTPTISNNNTITSIGASPYGAYKGQFVNGMVYADTTALNLGNAKFYDGAQAVTSSGGLKFWLRYLGQWYNVTGIVTASNGLVLSGSEVKLGGPLTATTQVGTGTFDLNFVTDNFTATTATQIGLYGVGGVEFKGNGSGGQYIRLNGDSAFATKRISYTGNVHASFTPFSLVTKKYTDSIAAAGIVTANNGLTKTANNIALGGNLTAGTQINLNNVSLLIDDPIRPIGLYLDRANQLTSIGDVSGRVNNSMISVDANNLMAYYDNTAHNGHFGINTTAPDSSLHVVGSANITGKLRVQGLTSAVGTRQVRYNPSTGNFSYFDTTAAITVPTWQQTLTAGSTLTKDNTITGGGFNFIHNGAGTYTINAGVGNSLSLNDGTIGSNDVLITSGENIRLNPTTAVILGMTPSGASTDSVLTWNSNTLQVRSRAASFFGNGTVTSVATNTGTGITGGTITTTGTLAIDTAGVIATKSRLTNTAALKLNLTDTASMLTPYFREVGVGLLKSGHVVRADTTVLASKTYVTNAIAATPSVNIYNSDGTLTGNRAMNLSENNFLINDGSDPFLSISRSANEYKFGDINGSSDGTYYFADAANATNRFFTASTERLTIDPVGNVGIGNAAPTVALDIQGSINVLTNNSTDQAIEMNVSTNDGGTILKVLDRDNAGDLKLKIPVLGGSNVQNFQAEDGLLMLMGGSNTGALRLSSYGAGAATFDASGNVSSVSDERLKFIQGYYTVGLAEVLRLNPIRYKWRPGTGMETETTYPGFSAQNVLAALGKEATGINSKGQLSIQDRAILAALCNAVKEQQAMIVALQKALSLCSGAVEVKAKSVQVKRPKRLRT